MEPLIIVSADSHIGPYSVADLGEYLEPKYRHLMPELIAAEENLLIDRSTGMSKLREMINADDPKRLELVDSERRLRSGGVSGAWDMERRLQELDADGVVAEVVYWGTAEALTPFNYNFNECYSADIRAAGSRAYQRWLADKIAPTKGRVIGTADPGPCLDMKAALAELRFAVDHGCRATFTPGHITDTDLPHLTDRHFEPFWAACSEMGVVLTAHIGYSTPQGQLSGVFAKLLKMTRELRASGEKNPGFDEMSRRRDSLLEEGPPLATDLGPRRAVWQLIFGGVFDRYPNLKINVAEVHGDWVPEYKRYIDERFLSAKHRPKIKMKPSDYFGRNVFITPTSPRRLEAQLRHEIGIDNFLFGSDFPHPESTWPNTGEWLQAAFFDLPENELRAIMGENAIRTYGLDRAWAAGIAAKIGPKPNDILGKHKVDDQLIQDFDQRAGFLQATPPLDQKLVDEALTEDLVATAA